MNIKIISSEEAVNRINSQSEEFVLIKNPEMVYPEFEIIPLAQKIYQPDRIVAFVMDMDGTTTTTEELCIESLEFMIRKMSGLLTEKQWQGLDHEKDYPNIIGNSTTKHIEYLIKTYHHLINPENTIKSFVEAIYWTIKIGKSEQRKKEIYDLFRSFSFTDVVDEYFNSQLTLQDDIFPEELSNRLNQKFDLQNFDDLVKMGIEIYYHHYHQYLYNLESDIQKKIKSKKLIEPLPGVSIFLALIKGLLGEELEFMFEKLAEDFQRKNPDHRFQLDDSEKVKGMLKHIGKYFEDNPAKVAAVTSSIYYEADVVLKEIFNQLYDEVNSWQISSSRKEKILEKFSSYQEYYDAIVTASDAYEFRLKPHRDLYSIALYKLGIEKKDFARVVGFEDSQSGTIAIRAAGIGCCCAVPFPGTKGHDLQAASHILWNGLPEFILQYKCLIKL